jgi:glycolate oxidase subunit GlcD
MPAIPEQLVKRLRQLVGPRYVLDERSELLVYESDGLTEFRVPPALVVLPKTGEQVQETVRLSNEYGIPFTARGAGTGLSGGSVPVPGGLVISLARMNRVIEVDYRNRRAVVEPGVLNLELSQLTMPQGYYYAPDPSSQPACTLGGNVAENAGGPHCLKYGVTLNHVLALEVVTPDGELVTLGGTGGDAVGYDLLGLFIGSEGTFGIATKLTLRLEPLPQAVRTVLADYLSIGAACQTVSDIIAAGIIPAALEMMDRRTIGTVEASALAAGYPTDAEAVLVIEVDGLEYSLDDQVERITEICRKNAARSVRFAADEAERKRLWAGRKAAFGAAGRLSPDLLVQDAVVPRTLLQEILPKVYQICDRHGVKVSNVFHAGDGNLHPNMNYDGRNKDEAKRVKEALSEVMNLCVQAGGTITGEHGVGLEKKEFMPLYFDRATLEAMARVKAVWDPRRLCNPGKVLPDRM